MQVKRYLNSNTATKSEYKIYQSSSNIQQASQPAGPPTLLAIHLNCKHIYVFFMWWFCGYRFSFLPLKSPFRFSVLLRLCHYSCSLLVEFLWYALLNMEFIVSIRHALHAHVKRAKVFFSNVIHHETFNINIDSKPPPKILA